MSQWQPIGIAPRNVRLILTFDFLTVYAGISDNNDTLWYGDGGWQVPQPTHWMYLPKAPKNAEALEVHLTKS